LQHAAPLRSEVGAFSGTPRGGCQCVLCKLCRSCPRRNGPWAGGAVGPVAGRGVRYGTMTPAAPSGLSAAQYVPGAADPHAA
jgi:hypothetical protein